MLTPTRPDVKPSNGWLSKDNGLTKFLERAPVLGYGVAFIQAAHGNEDQTVRAIAVCTNSTIVCAGIFIDTCSLGPIGALISTAVTTSIGIGVEVKIVDKWGKKPELRAQFEATHERYMYETFRNMVALGTGMYASKWLGSLAPKRIDTVAVSILKRLGSKTAIWAEGPVYGMVKLAIDRFWAQVCVMLIWAKDRISSLLGWGKAKLRVMKFWGEKIKCA